MERISAFVRVGGAVIDVTKIAAIYLAPGDQEHTILFGGSLTLPPNQAKALESAWRKHLEGTIDLGGI